MASFREDAIEDERAASPSLDGEFDGRDASLIAGEAAQFALDRFKRSQDVIHGAPY